MRKQLIVFPCNGNGLEALDCLGDAFELIGFVDDDSQKQGRTVRFEVFPRSILGRHPEALVLAVPGSPTSYRARPEAIASLGIPDARFARVIHPRACVADPRHVGFNTLVMAGVVLTANAQLGNHVCVLPNSVVHHDAVVGDYSLVGSNVTIAGNVRVGRGCYLGSGSTLMNGIEIGDGALIGLGSNVIRSVPAGSVVGGNPARLLR